MWKYEDDILAMLTSVSDFFTMVSNASEFYLRAIAEPLIPRSSVRRSSVGRSSDWKPLLLRSKLFTSNLSNQPIGSVPTRL